MRSESEEANLSARRGIWKMSGVVITAAMMLLTVFVFTNPAKAERICIDLGADAGAYEINENGQVMGGLSWTGFYWDKDSGMVDIGVLSGYDWTLPADMNYQGVIVGTCLPSGGGTSAGFIWDPVTRVMQKLGNLASGPTEAKGISDIGLVAGVSVTSDGFTHACTWGYGSYGTTPEDLGTLPGGDQSFTMGVSASGYVYGEAYAADGYRHAFYRDYHYPLLTDVGALLPSGVWSRAEHMAGQYLTGSYDRNAMDWGAFVFDTSNSIMIQTLPMTSIRGVNSDGVIIGGTYGGSFASAPPYDTFTFLGDGSPEDINEVGQICGNVWSLAGLHGCVWDPLVYPETYVMTDLGTLQGTPGANATALSINDAGQIVGWSAPLYGTGDNLQHAVMWREDAPPVALFTLQIIEQTADHMTVSFDASASWDSDGYVAGYVWDFGDGATGIGVTVVHEYARPDIWYNASLTVADEFGLTGSATELVGTGQTVEASVVELIAAIDATTSTSMETKEALKDKAIQAAQLIEARKSHGAQDIDARKSHGYEGAAAVLQVFDTVVATYTVVGKISPGEGWDLTCLANLITAMLANQVLIEGVPSYLWYHGCGPTVVGMMVGYWDSMRFGDLVEGDVSVQGDAANSMIASSGHIHDYAFYPYGVDVYTDPVTGQTTVCKDSPGNLIRDASYPGNQATHSDDCIADFMHTSRSQDQCAWGQSLNTRVIGGFTGYVAYASPHVEGTEIDMYTGVAKEDTSTSLSWGYLKDMVTAQNPMAFIVDINGDHRMDHIVAVIGYCQIGCARLYAFHSTWDDTIWWANFEFMDKSVYFGIYSGFEFDVVAADLAPP